MFAYGPADATAMLKPHHRLRHLHPDWFYLSGASFTQTPNPLPKKQHHIASGPGNHTSKRCCAQPQYSGASPAQNMWGGQTWRARSARAYNWGLEAERPPIPSPCKNSSDLYQFQQRSLAVHPVATPMPNCPPFHNLSAESPVTNQQPFRQE